MADTTPSLEEIAENLSQLLTNSVNIVDKYFDIFFNPSPMDVTLQQYNSSGSIVTYTIPNRAKDKSVADSGIVDPEGVITAGLGQLYVNTLTKNVFVKTTDSGNTGWINFTPEQTSIIRDTFTVTTSTTSVTLSQPVTSKDLTMVFFNNDYMPYNTYSLSSNNTITFLEAFTEEGTVEVRYFINLVLADSSVLTQAQAYANEAKNYRDQTTAMQIQSISIGNVTTGEAGSSATVTNSGTAKNQVWDMSIPRGNKGDAATISVGTVTTGSSGTPASVTNSGTSSAAKFDFVLPKGDTVVSAKVGTTTTLEAGSSATVTNSGTNTELTLNFGIPKGAKGNTGDQGPAGTVAVGTTTTGEAGSKASVTNSGTSTAAVLNFTIPKGDKGNQGDKGDDGDQGPAGTITIGTTTTGEAGSKANVTNSGTSTAAVLNFTIPKGDKGNQGDTGESGDGITQQMTTLSNGTIQLALGTAVYSKSITANTTFTFDVSQLGTITNKVVTFELYITMSTIYTLTFPSTVTWLVDPDFGSTGNYLIVFRTFNGGTSWIGNIEGTWS